MTNKDEQVELAKLAEQAQQYSGMVAAMKKVAEMNSELTDEERNLFSLAYTNVIDALRSSWKTMSDTVEDVENSGSERERAQKSREQIENELKTICHELLTLLDKHLIPNATTTEPQVFYRKMKGNCYRYLTDVATNSERQKLAEEAERAYQNGFDIAKNNMVVTHPIRLDFALSFSVFYHDILHHTDAACRLAGQAFNDALAGLDCIDEQSYKECTPIMQLLLDNLNVWTSNEPGINGANQTNEQ